MISQRWRRASRFCLLFFCCILVYGSMQVMAQGAVRYAVIGDYGRPDSGARVVADLIKT